MDNGGRIWIQNKGWIRIRKIQRNCSTVLTAPRILNPLKLGSMGAGSSVAGKYTADAPSEDARALVDKLGPDFDSLKARVAGLSGAALVDEVRAFQSFLDAKGPASAPTSAPHASEVPP